MYLRFTLSNVSAVITGEEDPLLSCAAVGNTGVVLTGLWFEFETRNDYKSCEGSMSVKWEKGMADRISW